jgi:hypothetical protein
MDGSEYNNLLRYLTKKEHNEKFTANEKRALKYIRIFQHFSDIISQMDNSCTQILSLG